MLLDGDSQDKLKSVEVASVDDVKGNKVSSSVNYNLLSKAFGVKVDVTKDDTTLKLSYDTESEDPVVKTFTFFNYICFYINFCCFSLFYVD